MRPDLDSTWIYPADRTTVPGACEAFINHYALFLYMGSVHTFQLLCWFQHHMSFARSGCTLVRDVVHSVANLSANADSPTHKLTTKGGRTLTAKKVLLACGAFINHYALLPSGRQLDIGMNPASVCMAEISERSAEMLATMPSMYMISGKDDNGLPVYILPPIKYPDGKTYIKIGMFQG